MGWLGRGEEGAWRKWQKACIGRPNTSKHPQREREGGRGTCLREGVEEDEGRDEHRQDLLLEERRFVLEEAAQELVADFLGAAPDGLGFVVVGLGGGGGRGMCVYFIMGFECVKQ